MNVRRSVVAVLAVATIVASIGAGAALTGGEPQGLKAVNVRSEALSVEHGLGEHSRSTASETQRDWLRALRIRSEALNARYGLGEHARSAAGSTTPVWLRALMLRS